MWLLHSLTHVGKTIKNVGPTRTIKVLWSSWQDWNADTELGIDTQGILHLEGNNTYFPSRSLPLKEFFAECKLPRNFLFVDVGAGKGRAMALAALAGFKRIKGIELFDSLCAIARGNLEKLQVSTPEFQFEVQCADALKYPIDTSDQIFYLYDPFDEKTTQAFFKRVADSSICTQFKVFVIYHINLLSDYTVGDAVFAGWKKQTLEFHGNRFYVYSN